MTYRPICGDGPCKQCPFRRASMPGWLGEATPESFIIEISYEHPLPCHPTIDYGDPDWLQKWTDQEIGRICVGSLIMSANMGKLPRDRAFPRMRADKATVFGSHSEFIAHHRNAPVRSWEMDGAEREIRAPKFEVEVIQLEQTELLRKAAMSKKPAKVEPSARDEYVQEVRDALETEATAMSRADYIDALEEIASEVNSMLDCARDEQASEERAARKKR